MKRLNKPQRMAARRYYRQKSKTIEVKQLPDLPVIPLYMAPYSKNHFGKGNFILVKPIAFDED